MKIKEETKVVKTKVYIAEDGEEFSTERECRSHENKLNLKRTIELAEMLRIEELDELLPLTVDEINENNTFRWYKVDNRKEFDILCEACREQFEYPDCYPEIVCIETVGYKAYDDDCYIYCLSRLKRSAEDFYKRLGYNITFEKVGE